MSKKITLCVTTEILAEYAEIIERFMGPEASEFVLSTFDTLPNLERVTTWFRFNLVSDPDDNKFVDCAISTNALFIVSHDTGFNILKKIGFPKVEVIDTVELKKRLEL